MIDDITQKKVREWADAALRSAAVDTIFKRNDVPLQAGMLVEMRTISEKLERIITILEQK
jgi:hypothetical protein